MNDILITYKDIAESVSLKKMSLHFNTAKVFCLFLKDRYKKRIDSDPELRPIGLMGSLKRKYEESIILSTKDMENLEMALVVSMIVHKDNDLTIDYNSNIVILDAFKLIEYINDMSFILPFKSGVKEGIDMNNSDNLIIRTYGYLNLDEIYHYSLLSEAELLELKIKLADFVLARIK